MDSKNVYSDGYRANKDDIAKLQHCYLGFQHAASIHAMAQLRIPEKLGTNLNCKRSAFDLANEIGANPVYLERVMHTLSLNGFFTEVPGYEIGKRVFQHNHLSLTMADPYIRDEVLLMGSLTFYRSYETLADSIMTGQPQSGKALNCNNIWEFIQKNQDQEIIFSKAMTSISIRHSPYLVSLIDFSKFDTICDVGGSEGIMLFEILKLYPSVKNVINFDLPTVLQNLEGIHHRQLKLDQRYSEIQGSFFDGVPEADCYILKTVIHTLNDEQSKLALMNISKSIRPKGKVFIIDLILDEESKLSEKYSSILDIHMLQLCGAKERSIKEWKELSNGTPLKFETIIYSNQINCQNIIVYSME
ncbi:hypothetical protein PPL_05304 [Heterostelium album PN500]|uniref:O-methyltransferase C-terminal domain-containing protein n=1 Tax=Heterostelium pallidum (strain ATCC 26659 / Pp 5 / PN500) TaxID=670386 RepID=D3BBB7_HETP5|nr:hypothetical protein PPL_05304 [Heterostelium album PN500]EFA81324.1 hypothetical protein PPL_05304 [Heterostelium album PN500]|eukprot:XP_020433442.1 hypothetical protein PPL_05304 [Heterostelium album PN500]